MSETPERNVSESRRNYLHGIAGAISLSAAATGSVGTAVAGDASRFTSDLGEIEDATLAGEAENAIIVESGTTPVAPGIEYQSFVRLTERGWLDCDLLTVALDEASNDGQLLSPGVTSRETVSTLAENRGAVAGVNGDFFDIGNTDSPIGAEIGNGEIRSSPATGRTSTVAVERDGLGRIAQVVLEGHVELPNGNHPLVALNQPTISDGGIGLYTPLWNDVERPGTVEVLVRNETVVSSPSPAGDGTIPDDSYVLAGRGAGADALSALWKGDSVSVTYGPKTDANSPLDVAIGGGTRLVIDGKIPESLDDDRLEPRTAAGVSADGKTLFLFVVDGRQRDSRGASLRELGEAMRDLGASAALNLDGGGSSTLVAREPGEAGVRVRNDPSDGSERPVSNGFGLAVEGGSGTLDGFNVTPVLDGENTHRVFPNLSRQFEAMAHDETYTPVEATPKQWRAVPGKLGRFDDDGIVTARKSGSGEAVAHRGQAKSATELRVLGDLDRIEADTKRIGLAADDSSTFAVLGFDAQGYTAPVEPRDISLSYDESLVTIEPTDEGVFSVTPKGRNGSTLVTVSVLNEEAYLPVSVGLATEQVSGFEDPSAWYFSRYPSAVEGSMSFVEGRNGTGLELEYDFSTTTATRAVYARTESNIDLPGEPQRIGVWVHGDGRGAWLRGVVYDAAGVAHRLNFTYSVDWTGWQYVEALVPAGVEYPLQFSHLYPVEASSDQQYTGSLVFDDLTVKVTPPVSVPDSETEPDPMVVRNDTLSDDRWTFAAMADSQFVGDNPDGLTVELARRTLREIVAADPEFLVIVGDFVDRGYARDYDLAQRILREEVGDALPVYYIPGNHERVGPSDLSNFDAAFGNRRYVFDHDGTRFFLLDSSTGSFRTAEFRQLFDLRQGLQEAATDDSVNNVVVMAHHPTRDPLPTDNSQLGDRMEAELIEEWLTAFRRRSDGKGATYVAGHAGTVDFSRVEGVPYTVLGTSGKDPYGPAANGGFREWRLFGIDGGIERSDDPVERTDWLRAEVRPLLEGIDLGAPDSLAVGETATVIATGEQAAGLTFPLRYPATVRWDGSSNLLVADADENDENDGREDDQKATADEYVARFDPTTGELTGMRSGTVVLRVESNGTSEQVQVTVKAGN
ncbi:phosphodiester glycosidase family protein [Haladaptatus caseinilyticus]|uniref:phosphodiester glycosidase family protein n=1 Tax=Haladaptatus caseinilyticus TaxID=2993314 RepID=UPI00224B5B58|nr:phosphodiester glycosidase family protein [Haladaptatus caseinilyticus]